MATGDIYEVRWEGITCEGERWNIVTHWHLNDQEPGTLFETSTALAVAASSAFGTHVLQIQTAESTFTGARANRVWPSLGVPSFSSEDAGPGLVITTEPLPADVAAVISKRTDEPGRRAMGRMYLGNLSEFQNEAGAIPTVAAQAIVDDMNDCFVAVVTGMAATVAIGPVVFSRTAAAAQEQVVAWAVRTLQVDKVLRKMSPRGSSLASYLTPTVV